MNDVKKTKLNTLKTKINNLENKIADSIRFFDINQHSADKQNSKKKKDKKYKIQVV